MRIRVEVKADLRASKYFLVALEKFHEIPLWVSQVRGMTMSE